MEMVCAVQDAVAIHHITAHLLSVEPSPPIAKIPHVGGAACVCVGLGGPGRCTRWCTVRVDDWIPLPPFFSMQDGIRNTAALAITAQKIHPETKCHK